MIAASDELVCTRVPELETDCEMVWVKVRVKGRRDLLLCAYCRPPRKRRAKPRDVQRFHAVSSDSFP